LVDYTWVAASGDSLLSRDSKTMGTNQAYNNKMAALYEWKGWELQEL
jgi:hypothetical protein